MIAESMGQYLVIGAGSIGKRHHGNIEALGGRARLLGWRGLDLGALDQTLAGGDVTGLVIATATPVRRELIALAAQHGVAVYVEKPLAYRMAELERLIELAAPIAERSVLGLMMRYHPALLAQHEAALEVYGFSFEIGHDVRQWRQNWRFAESYAANAEGGGVLLDLCHEIDMAHCLFPGLAVSGVDCIGHRDFPGVDFATRIALASDAGPVGQVAMDYLSPRSIRRMQLRGRSEVVDIDLLGPSETRATGAGETTRDWTFDRNDMFLGLMRDFMALAEGRQPSDNPLLPRLSAVYASAALVARAWEARRFHSELSGGFE